MHKNFNQNRFERAHHLHSQKSEDQPTTFDFVEVPKQKKRNIQLFEGSALFCDFILHVFLICICYVLL